MEKENKEELIKKWGESGVLDGLTEMDKESSLLKLYEPSKEQKINEISDIEEYEFWFKEKFGCLPFEKHHGVGPTNIEEALSLRRDFPNDLSYSVITFEEYKNSKQK